MPLLRDNRLYEPQFLALEGLSPRSRRASASGGMGYANSRLGIVAYFSKIEIVKSKLHFQQGIGYESCDF